MISVFVHVTDLLSKYGISDSVMLIAGKSSLILICLVKAKVYFDMVSYFDFVVCFRMFS